MIEVYKMGMSYYNNGVDKNSGLTELKMIEMEAKRINEKHPTHNALIVVNGIRDREDDIFFRENFKNYRNKIFVMSDAIALKTSLDIINSCDVFMHQVPDKSILFEGVKCKQVYSFVPELFYKYIKYMVELGFIDVQKSEGSKVYFGGNNTGRQDKFDSYNIMQSDLFSKSCKIDGVKDERLDHISYLKELAKYKYSLTICRDEYRNNGWLTSRFFESVALGCLPIIDYDYDKLVEISKFSNYFRSFNESSLREIIKFYEKNENERLDILKKLDEMCYKKCEGFSETIVNNLR